MDPALLILGQVGDALDYAHRHGVLHRNLKPSNIIVEQDPGEPLRAVLIDFSLTKDWSLAETDTTYIWGTPQYMAPEVIKKGDIGAAADLYALGVVAYKMLTGSVPYGGDDGGITFYETYDYSISAPQYGAKIFYSESGDELRLGTIQNNSFLSQIEIPRASSVVNTTHLRPQDDNTFDLGATSKRWRNIYSADLQLSNEGTEGNEVDGTTGSWTIQEGEDDLYLLNRKNGKKYRFKLEEVE